MQNQTPYIAEAMQNGQKEQITIYKALHMKVYRYRPHETHQKPGMTSDTSQG